MELARHHSYPSSSSCTADPVDLMQVAEATRRAFRLVERFPVRVEQLRTTERGFPLIETCITFWTGNTAQHRYRVFKPAKAVSESDLPPWWMKDAVVVDDQHPHCDCCG